MNTQIFTSKNSTKIQLSLASMMFFSPLVKRFLNKSTIELNPAERNFIEGYIKLGNINIILLLVIFILGTSNYYFQSGLIDLFYTLIIMILILFLVVGIVCIFTNTQLISENRKLDHSFDAAKCSKKDVLLSYIPLYNIYHWYTHPDQDEVTHSLFREGIALWSLIILFSLFNSSFFVGLLVIFVAFRIIGLLASVDILSKSIKNILQEMFIHNPEEIWGYLTGISLYFYKNFTSPNDKSTADHEITREKTIYSLLSPLKHRPLLKFQYSIGVLLILLFILSLGFEGGFGLIYFALVIIVSRYLIMYYTTQQLPQLPIAREIGWGLVWIYHISKPWLKKVIGNHWESFISKLSHKDE